MSKKQIFTVFSCDEHCSRNSQKLILCVTSPRKLKTFICREIQKGHFEYNNSEWSKEKQIEDFKKDFNNNLRHIINIKLKYGFYDYCYDGEPI